MDEYDVITKLIGPIQPTGETFADAKRLRNLETTIDLIQRLIADIRHASVAKCRTESSMKAIGEAAADFLEELKD